jgi:hypothetical protein
MRRGGVLWWGWNLPISLRFTPYRRGLDGREWVAISIFSFTNRPLIDHESTTNRLQIAHNHPQTSTNRPLIIHKSSTHNNVLFTQ